MEDILSHKASILSVLMVIIAFAVYFSLTFSMQINNIFLKKFGEERGQLRMILFQRLCGVALFGIIPVFIFFLSGFKLADYGFRLKFDFFALCITLLLGGILVLINFFTAKSEQNLAMYPQIRIKNWSVNLVLLSAISWMAYLLAYELLFRGLLLFSCYQELGLINAIIINVILYSLVHLPKGLKESVGSVPLGIVLCLISIYFGTFWASFWIHCFLALSNEWYSIKYSNNIKVL